MEILQFVFSSFWIWLGFLLIVSVIFTGLSRFRLVEIRFSRDVRNEGMNSGQKQVSRDEGTAE